MKKIVFLSLVALCLPWTLAAQSVDDDLYYVPTKKKVKVTQNEQKKVQTAETVVVKSDAPTTVYSSNGNTTVVVRDRKGRTRDVDEYNRRRYDSRDYAFSQENDTLYIDEKPYDGLDGEWVNGFDGSQDDYEYATRIIRFRNPRYAISVSSPLYWDVVYGLNSWEWNVYTDGLYAYAFPTFTNRLWWDWRYNSYGWGWGYPYYGWGWNSWYTPGWSFGWSWGGWYAGGWWGHHHQPHHPGWYPGNGHFGHGPIYTDRRSFGVGRSSVGNRIAGTTYRSSSTMQGRTIRRSSGTNGQVRRSSTTQQSNRRVVGTRSSSGVRSSVGATRSSSGAVRSSGTTTNRVNSVRTDAASTRRTTYTRPSSTRSSSVNNSGTSVRGSSVNNGGTGVRSSNRSSSATYSRGSSTSATRTYSTGNRSNDNGATRSYNNSNRSSSSRSSGSFSSGSSTRSSGSFSGGGSSRSGGGSARRR